MVQRYDRVRHISTGRFGVTVLVKNDDRLAVMKTINVGRLASKVRQDIVDEVLTIAQLRHPNLVAIQECFVREGMLCVIFQYVEGGTLLGQIEKARQAGLQQLSQAKVLSWCSEALLGLHHLHSRSIPHRDLRARRLLLSSDGHVSLCSASLSTLIVQQSLAADTPDLEQIRYASPELLSAKEGAHQELSLASDLWAFGVILYELLCLQPPFDSPHPHLLVERIVTGPVPPLPARCCSVMQQVCSRLLRRSAEKRSSTAELLRESLVQQRLWQLLEDQPTSSFAGPALPAQSPRLPHFAVNGRLRSGLPAVGTAAQSGTQRALQQAACGLLSLPRAHLKKPPERGVTAEATSLVSNMLGAAINAEDTFADTFMSGTMMSSASSWQEVPSGTFRLVDP